MNHGENGASNRNMTAQFIASLGCILTLQVAAQRPRDNSPALGSLAPEFTAKHLGRDETFSLKSNFGKVPTVLIFGSYT